MSSLERREWLVAIAIGVFVHPLGALVGPWFSDKGQPLGFHLSLWGFAAIFSTVPLLLLAVIASLFRGERRRHAPARQAFHLLAGLELLFQGWAQIYAFALLPEGAAGTHGMLMIAPLVAHLGASVLALVGFFVFQARHARRTRAGLSATAQTPATTGGGPRPA